MSANAKLTSIQQIKGIVERVTLILLRVSAKDDESISDEQTGMSHSRTGTFGLSAYGIAVQVTAASFNHPQVTFDCLSIDQAPHNIYISLF